MGIVDSKTGKVSAVVSEREVIYVTASELISLNTNPLNLLGLA